MEIPVIKACYAPQGINVMMTTAEGGANFRKHAAVYPEERKTHFEEFRSQIAVDYLVTLHQIHSSDVVKVSSNNYIAVDGVSADGLYTADVNLAIGVLTADCYPVFIAGKKYVSALHCGWRGTVKGIISNAAACFEKNGDEPVYAYIGAGISKEAFEVKDDFLLDVSKYIEPEKYLSVTDGKKYFDLMRLIMDQLYSVGVGFIETAAFCTVSSPGFYSYRRDKDTRRMLSVIYKSPQQG